MKCPKCRLENPPSAQRCDCGYDFESGVMKSSYLQQALREKSRPHEARKPSAWTLVAGWTLSLLGGLLGIWIARHIAYGKDKEADPTGMTFLYDEDSRKGGRQMQIVAIVMTFIWIAMRGARRP